MIIMVLIVVVIVIFTLISVRANASMSGLLRYPYCSRPENSFEPGAGRAAASLNKRSLSR